MLDIVVYGTPYYDMFYNTPYDDLLFWPNRLMREPVAVDRVANMGRDDWCFGLWCPAPPAGCARLARLGVAVFTICRHVAEYAETYALMNNNDHYDSLRFTKIHQPTTDCFEVHYSHSWSFKLN